MKSSGKENRVPQRTQKHMISLMYNVRLSKSIFSQRCGKNSFNGEITTNHRTASLQGTGISGGVSFPKPLGKVFQICGVDCFCDLMDHPYLFMDVPVPLRGERQRIYRSRKLQNQISIAFSSITFNSRDLMRPSPRRRPFSLQPSAFSVLYVARRPST